MTALSETGQAIANNHVYREDPIMPPGILNFRVQASASMTKTKMAVDARSYQSTADIMLRRDVSSIVSLVGGVPFKPRITVLRFH